MQVSLDQLEARFKLGVLHKPLAKADKNSIIECVMIRTCLLTFSTSKLGYHAIGRGGGKLLEKADGDVEAQGHAVIVESYDFRKDVFIAQNSWGKLESPGVQGRFEFRFEAFHRFKIFDVYFTTSSIPRMLIFDLRQSPEYEGQLLGEVCRCVTFGDQQSASASSDYICLDFESLVGYRVSDYINILAKKPPTVHYFCC